MKKVDLLLFAIDEGFFAFGGIEKQCIWARSGTQSLASCHRVDYTLRDKANHNTAKIMEDLPRTTLTQRRSEVMSGARKLNKEALEHDEMPEPIRPSVIANRSAGIKIAIWVAAVVLLGIGSALFLTNLLNRSAQVSPTPSPTPTATPASLPRVTPTPEPEITPTPSASTTPAPTATPVAGADGVVVVEDLAAYATTNRLMRAETEGNNLIFNKLRFFQTATEFNYLFTEVSTATGEIDPQIKVSYEDNDVVVEFGNMRRDNVTGNENTTSRTFTAIPGITGTETKNASGVSQYRFKMQDNYPVKVLVDASAKEIRIQIDNMN